MKMKKSETRSTTLPAVLKEYVPEYDPKSSVKRTQIKDEKTVKISTQEEIQKPKSSGYGCRHTSPEHARSTSAGAASTTKRKRAHPAQKYEDLSQKWDQAKTEVRQDDYEQLKRKIGLQQELIRRQDTLIEQKRAQQQQEIQQKKEEEKKKRRELQASLEEKCKKSLEEDKKSAKGERKKKTKGNVAQPLIVTERTPSAGNVTQKSGSAGSGRASVSPGTRQGRGFQASLPPMSRTPSNPDLGGPESKPGTPMSEKEMLEWYQVQLYQKFGPEKADYFLHPKIEQKTTKPIHPKLHKHGDVVNPLTGRAGAEKLLDILRKESMIRLYKEDAKIPREYKDAYNALVRFHLGKYNVNLRRIFAADNEDVSEIARLSDQSVMRRVRNQRHKTELMYRASVNNQDRTNILNIENPVNQLDAEIGEGVAKYLPSWLDDSSDFSEEEYKRWVRGQENERTFTSEPIAEEDTEDLKDNFKENIKPEEQYSGLDDELVMLMSRKRHRKPRENLKFLTEKDTRYKGGFSEKFKEDRDIPRAFNEAKAPENKSHSVMGMRASSDEHPSCKSAPIPDKHRKYYTNYVSDWQPLSMHALVEYKKKMDSEGDGEFNQGRAKVWKTQLIT
ncbi:Hypothetical predicted protein [Mytilus galloprovincialis]|uniref:Uncharacterized protein n=2 Tax=Mytilus galloprovincialis TaxID=29158 RepID=A0A8B6F728_MYTGA|nr:Hypothetical predicted protein [Mytilus galloprovincialis]